MSTYDFGDTSEHSIVVEKRLPAAPNMIYPICTDGQIACPPEDCGGIPGFNDLLDALRDPTQEEYQELRHWVGGDYDPELFSIEAVNRTLTRLIPAAVEGHRSGLGRWPGEQIPFLPRNRLQTTRRM